MYYSSWYKGNTVSSNYIDKGHTLKGTQADMRRVSVTKLLQHTRSYSCYSQYLQRAYIQCTCTCTLYKLKSSLVYNTCTCSLCVTFSSHIMRLHARIKNPNYKL